jgi:hypothetical protein
VEGVANVQLSYGLLARVEDRDSDLVAIANGGSSESANFDDGDLNYDEAVASNMLQASGEVFARWGFLGAYVRGIAYYDFETQLSDRARTSLSSDADRYVGWHTELRDYHLGARFQIRGMPVSVRVGDQVLNWGESTFLRFGVQTVTPLDLVAALRPASSAQDVQNPQGMIWAAANLTEEVAIEGYYQYAWQRTRTPPIGWLFSDSDSVGADGLGAAMAGGGVFSDLGTDLDDFFQLPAGTLGFDPEFMRIPGVGSHEPSSQGQGGFTVQAILPRFNSTKLALHFMNYHSRLPLLNARTADAAAVSATSPAAVAARAASLAPVYEAEGLPPAQAALAAAAAAGALTVGEYAGEASFFVTYPENVQMLGLSFNTTTLRSGTLVSGEISHFRLSLPDPPGRRLQRGVLADRVRSELRAGAARRLRTEPGGSRNHEARQDPARDRNPPAPGTAPRRRAEHPRDGRRLGARARPAGPRPPAPLRARRHRAGRFRPPPRRGLVGLSAAGGSHLRGRARRLHGPASRRMASRRGRCHARSRWSLRLRPQGLQRRSCRRLHQHLAAPARLHEFVWSGALQPARGS